MRDKTLKRVLFERVTLGAMLLMFLYFLFHLAGLAAPAAYVAPSVESEPEPETWPSFANTTLITDKVQLTPAPSVSLPDLIGVNDIIFQPETNAANAMRSIQTDAVTFTDTDKLYDFDYLRSQFYLVDADTGLLPGDIDMDYFLNADLSIDTAAPGPTILIFHTHSNEMYADSNPDDPMDGIMGIGKALADILTTEYGVQTLHHTGRYDIVDGKSQVPGAYERMEPAVEQILRDNPSIQMVIDLHRDGLRDGVPPMVTDIDGQRAARIMLLNGLCRLRTGGVLSPVAGLTNPYITDNMALSMQLQLSANTLYPDFTRRLYLKAYRYSLNMLPRSILVEVGAQNNTKQEALNAMPPLAELIARVVLP